MHNRESMRDVDTISRLRWAADGSLDTMMPDIQKFSANIRLRVAFVAEREKDFQQKKSLRRIQLTGTIAIYTQLYCISEHTLFDISTADITMQEVFDEHESNSAVVREFNLANGTNVRLQEGETIFCLGKDEHVAMKLTKDNVVTYRDAESTSRLLELIDDLLQVRIYAVRSANN